MQTIKDPNLKRLVREGPVGVAFLLTIAFGSFVCFYVGVIGFVVLAFWGYRLADVSENFFARRLKRCSV